MTMTTPDINPDHEPMTEPDGTPDQYLEDPSASEVADTIRSPESGERKIEPEIDPEADEIDIDALLAESDQLVADHEQAQADELKDLLQERDVAIASIKTATRNKESRTRVVDNFKNPFANLSTPNGLSKGVRYKLVLLGIFSGDDATRLDKSSKAIKILTAINPKSPQIVANIEALKSAEAKILNGTLEKIAAGCDAVEARRDVVRQKVEAHGDKRISVHRATIDKINANPSVEESNEDFLSKIRTYLNFLGNRNRRVFEKLAELSGDADIVNKLRKAYSQENYLKFDEYRAKLAKAVLKGDLRRPFHVVPWKDRPFVLEEGGSLTYFDLTNILDSEETHDLLCAVKKRNMSQRADDLVAEKKLLVMLFGLEKESRGRKKSSFWKAFDKVKRDKRAAAEKYAANRNNKNRHRRGKKNNVNPATDASQNGSNAVDESSED